MTLTADPVRWTLTVPCKDGTFWKLGFASEAAGQEFIAELTQEAVDKEREACAVAAEVWTEGRSRFITAADAIRARKPLK